MDQPQTAFMGSYTHLDPTRWFFGTTGWSLTFTAPGMFSYRALPIAAL